MPKASNSRDRLTAILRPLGRDPFTAFLLIASIGLALAFLLLLGSTRPSSEGERTAISEVQELASDREIERATILDYDDRVVAHLRDGRTVWATYPSADGQAGDMLATLERGGAVADVDPQTGKDLRRVVVQFLIPILLLVCLFALFTRIGQSADGGSGVAAFSRWRGRARSNGESLSFADVAGATEAVVELKEICDFLADPGRYAGLGARAPKGVLLVGPPGTGKTLLARATAGEANATFLSMSGSEFVESLVGVGAARVRDVFDQARRHAPAIVFIDELDAAGRKRGAGVGQGNDEREQTLNQLLVEMDGFEGDAGIVVLAATNRPDILDPALLRPGRFDRRVTIDVPDMHGRAEILDLHLRRRPVSGEVEIADIARLCPGFTGADLANVANEAALLAVRAGNTAIAREDLEEGIERVASGPERRSHVLTADERWAIAIHEASHAVVARKVGQVGSTQKLSIVARGRQVGTAATLLGDRDRTILGEADLLRQLATVMAGAAGERRAFGEHSTTVHDDLHAATQLARSMVTSFGMSALGPVTIGERQGDVFLGASLQELSSVGPRTLETIDEEVRRLVEDAEERALAVLEGQWDTVETIAETLIVKETLSGPELELLLAGIGPDANGKPAV